MSISVVCECVCSFPKPAYITQLSQWQHHPHWELNDQASSLCWRERETQTEDSLRRKWWISIESAFLWYLWVKLPLSPQRSSRLAWKYVATVAVIDFWFMPIPLPCLFSHWVPPYATCEFETASVFQWKVYLSGHHHWTASQITSTWQECLWVMEDESLPTDKEPLWNTSK